MCLPTECVKYIDAPPYELRLRDAAAAIGRHFKQGQHIGHAEKLADLLTQIDDLKPATGGFRRDVQADNGSQAHAVAITDVGQIQHDPQAWLNQLPDLGSKKISALERQASATTHDSGVRLHLDVKAEGRWSAH